MLYEIWLGSDYSYFERGVAHFDNSEPKELKGWIHYSTYGSNSILIDIHENIASCEFTLRWFINEGAIDFYCVQKDTPDVLFHNTGTSDIRIDRFGILKSGASIKVNVSQICIKQY